MLRPDGRLVNIFTLTADGDIARDTQEAERRGFRKIVSIMDFERARESIRKITYLIDRGVVRVPPIDVLPLEKAAPRARDNRHRTRPGKTGPQGGRDIRLITR